MAMLDLDDPKSVFDNIKSTESEMRLIDRDIWPGTSLVPVEARLRYRNTLVAQRKYLIGRYLDMVPGGVLNYCVTGGE